ncbi:MAG: cysteine--tRNA ligase [archaeon]
MALQFFNTRTRSKEPFMPVTDIVRLYTCGPTVYNYAHLGNFRTYIFEDLLRRYLEFKGYTVKQVMNLTDVDDKTIKGSQAEHTPLAAFTKKYKDAFFADIKTLNIEPADVYPEATMHVKEMILLIKALLKKGLAYKGEDGSIYFSIKKFPGYGKLSHTPIENLQAGARVKQDEYEKESAADFALWKAWDEQDGPVFWESPLGKGRPGWHIECSAMSMKHLTTVFDDGFHPERFETIDLHTGGVDNLFPHHEDETAQSEGVTGKRFVNFWLHAEHLIVDGKKMSKSLGNFYTLRDVLAKGYLPKAIRYCLLSTHYRQQLNFTFDSLAAAQTVITRFRDFMLKLNELVSKHQDAVDEKIAAYIAKAREDFTIALDDDLNISEGLAVLFEFMRLINTLMPEMSGSDAAAVLSFVEELDTVLGLLDFDEETLDPELQALIEQREDARAKRDYKRADQIRKALSDKGIILEDTPQGVRWKKEL